MSNEIEVPVIIVGGGGCGLTLSGFLSNYGIEHALFEKHTSTSILPKAHYLNQRTMETLRNHHMIEEILQKTCPSRHMSQVAWQTSLGGSGLMDRKVISKFECFGGNDGTEFAESYKSEPFTLQITRFNKLSFDTDVMLLYDPETFPCLDLNRYYVG